MPPPLTRPQAGDHALRRASKHQYAIGLLRHQREHQRYHPVSSHTRLAHPVRCSAVRESLHLRDAENAENTKFLQATLRAACFQRSTGFLTLAWKGSATLEP